MNALRTEIELVQAGVRALLFDPMRHRYFAVPDQPSEDADRAFVRRNELAVVTDEATVRELTARSHRARQTWWQAAAHRYLFLRIPLVRPDRLLDTALPFVRPLLGRGGAIAFLILGLLAAFLVSRRLDAFVSDLAQLLTWQGALLYAVALGVLKTLHELGHAFALKARGGRVPSMGVAFVVLFPILYTDTSDAWLLPRKRDRLTVDLAGVAAELAVAVVATWMWIVLPEGAARSVAFSLAALSWTLSLAVNLNPFMRFDGYYVLSDAAGIPNLQERAFALARWRLRELLFAPGAAAPETFRPRTRRWLVAYAWTTWAYRLVLFTGIALLVYHATFKALGVVLFVAEMFWFVARPVWREVHTWPPLVRGSSPRSWLPFGIVGLVLACLLAPLDRSVTLPAVLEVGQVHELRAPRTGRLRAMTSVAGPVRRGAVVARFERSEDAFDLRKMDVRLGANRLGSKHDPGGLRRRLLQSEEEKLISQARKRTVANTLRGFVVAPADGELVPVRGLGFGRTFAQGDVFARLIAAGNGGAALADVAARDRLNGPMAGRFVPDVGGATIDVRLEQPPDLPVPSIRRPELAVRHGGSLIALDEATWRSPHFAIGMEPLGKVALPVGRWRGMVTVAVPARSYAGVIARRLHSVWVRETGF